MDAPEIHFEDAQIQRSLHQAFDVPAHLLYTIGQLLQYRQH